MLIGEKLPQIQNGLDIFNIHFNELPTDLQIVADKCGIETAFILLKHLQGTSIYIPRIAKLSNYILRYLKENNNKSVKQVAIELGVSENHIRKLKYEL